MRYSIKDYSISAARKGWGQGWPTCTAKTQTAVIVAPISGVKVVVHKRAARLAFLLIAETERRGYLLRTGQTWGGNCRAIAGTSVSSNHAWWIAVDINSLANPYIKKGLRVTDFPNWLPLMWNAFGWAWGGTYGDSMHLEFMGSPEDADDMTALAEQRLAPGLGGTAAAGLIPLTPEDDMYDPTDRSVAGDRHTQLIGALDSLSRRLDRVPLAVWDDQVAGPVQDATGGPQQARSVLADVFANARASAELARALATRDDVDESALGRAIAGALAAPVIAALGEAKGITRADVEDAVRTVLLTGADRAA